MITLQQLKATRDELASQIASLQAKLKETDASIAALLDRPVDDEFDAAGKQHGVVSLQVEGIDVKAEITKTVAWDSEKLLTAMSGMTWEKAKTIFDVKVSIKETVYNSLLATASEDFIAKINAARTVKYSDPKISFKE